jgi:hypothetical protein
VKKWLLKLFKKKVRFNDEDYEWSQRLATQEDIDEWNVWAKLSVEDSGHVSHYPFREGDDGKLYKICRIKKEKL